MASNSEAFEINQSINKNGKIAPLRDTFFLSLSGDALNLMTEEQLDACFNPSKLQFFIYKQLIDTGYELLSDGFRWRQNGNLCYFCPLKSGKSEDYTRCFYEDKLEKYLDSECLESAVIDGKLSSDSSLTTVLFESQFPFCHERQP